MITTTISHPTKRPNYSEVRHFTQSHTITVAYSYETPIGFQASNYNNGRPMTRQNEWSNTTGRHLNEWQGHNTDDRIPGDEFLSHLSSALFHTFAPVVRASS